METRAQKISFQTISVSSVFESPALWDDSILGLGLAHPYQSVAFAKCMRATGQRPVFVKIFCSDILAGYCLCFLGMGKILSCFYGPVLDISVQSIVDRIVVSLVDYFKGLGLAGTEIFLTAPAYPSSQMNDLTTDRGGGSGILNHPKNTVEYDVGPEFSLRETPVLCVTSSIEEQLRGMDHSLRKNIRKCNEAGVEVEFRTDVAAAEMYRALLLGHRRRLGERFPHFYPSTKNLSEFSEGRATMEIALARYEGRYLSAIGFVRFGNVFTEVGVAQSEDYFDVKLPAQELLKVKAIERYSKLGATHYDLAGVGPHTGVGKEANIRRFKFKFTKTISAYWAYQPRPARFLSFKVLRLILKLRERWSTRLWGHE